MRMRSLVLWVVSVAACDSSSTSTTGAPSDASVDGGSADGATKDAASDGDGGDGGTCALLGGTYDKTCGTPNDCLMLARGCYCGAQPIVGVAKAAQPAAQACESKAATNCTLGCANSPGHVADDGQNDDGTGRNIAVTCDAGGCYTYLAP